MPAPQEGRVRGPEGPQVPSQRPNFLQEDQGFNDLNPRFWTQTPLFSSLLEQKGPPASRLSHSEWWLTGRPKGWGFGASCGCWRMMGFSPESPLLAGCYGGCCLTESDSKRRSPGSSPGRSGRSQWELRGPVSQPRCCFVVLSSDNRGLLLEQDHLMNLIATVDSIRPQK